MRTIVRNLVPLRARQEIKHYLRQLTDVANRTAFDNSKGILQMQQPICIAQPIVPSELYHNKLMNISRGANLLDQCIVRPKRNWSFWHIVKRPDASNGFVVGRNLVNGQLVAQSGGGLCQLASMVYHLALLGGLTIVERHAHSIDIYEESQRFTPLGADATVVWGFKDLRLSNPYPFAVSFEFAVEQGQLIGKLNADHELVAQQVEFVRIPLEKPFIKIHTFVNQEIQVETIYEQKQGLQVAR